MTRCRHYDPQHTKMIAVFYDRQLLQGIFEHALSYLFANEIDLSRFSSRFKNDDTGALAYDPAVLLKVVLFDYSRSITSREDARSVRFRQQAQTLEALPKEDRLPDGATGCALM